MIIGVQWYVWTETNFLGEKWFPAQDSTRGAAGGGAPRPGPGAAKATKAASWSQGDE